MNHTHNVIIVGTNHHNTLSMVRCFGEEGQNVILFIYGAANSYIASSKYVEKSFFFPTASAALDAILSFSENAYEKPIVIACSDEVSSLMDKRYAEFAVSSHFFNAGEPGRINYFMDKQIQLDLAKKCGFSTPKSNIYFPDNVNYNEIDYPCFVKPQASILGGKHISICYTCEELKRALAQYDPKYNVLVQDYIIKDYEIVVLGLSIGDDVIVPGFVQKNREEKGGTTFGTVKSCSEIEQWVVEACKKIIKQIGYQGLWGIECIKKGNDYYFLELNLRNDATTYALKVAGVNLPYLYFQFVLGSNVEYEQYSVRKINSIVEFNDIIFVLKRKVNLFRWLREYKNAECKYFYSDADIIPFKMRKAEFIDLLRKRIRLF